MIRSRTTTRANAYSDSNLLALTYFAIVPALFVPGNDVTVYTSAEACPLDVETGVFLTCSQGHGAAARSFVILGGRERRLRDLAIAATGSALERVPSDLVQRLHARLSEANAASGTVLSRDRRSPGLHADGVRYETRGDLD